MKRKIFNLLAFALLITLSFFLVSCYQSKPGLMKDLTGTYELTKFTWRAKGDEADENKDDMLKNHQITAYLVINSDGTGYYCFKSDEKALYAEEIRITYTYDEDEPSKIKEISYTNGSSTTVNRAPGNGRERLGLYFKVFSKTLNYTDNASPSSCKKVGRQYSQSVSYKRVSRKTDLSYASKKMGKELTTTPFEYHDLSGVYVMSYDSSNTYDYFIIDLSYETLKADVYYRMYGTSENQVKRNLDVQLDIKSGTNGLPYVEVSVDGVTYTRMINADYSISPSLYLNYGNFETQKEYYKDTNSLESVLNNFTQRQ